MILSDRAVKPLTQSHGDMRRVPCLGQEWSGFPLGFCASLCYNLDMHKMFQYRILLTKKQITTLTQTLDKCRWLSNHFLEKRKTTYEQEGKTLSCYHQIDTLGLLKGERPSLKHVHSQVLQNVAVRIDRAFKAFFYAWGVVTIP